MLDINKCIQNLYEKIEQLELEKKQNKEILIDKINDVVFLNDYEKEQTCRLIAGHNSV